MARVWRQRLGVGKGERFAMLADNRPEVLDAFFAAPKAGVILVPLSTRLTPRELAGGVLDSGLGLKPQALRRRPYGAGESTWNLALVLGHLRRPAGPLVLLLGRLCQSRHHRLR
jgi:hypothetical protein